MKTYSLDEVTDKFVGKKGTQNRDAFENELKLELIGQTIKQSRFSNVRQPNNSTF